MGDAPSTPLLSEPCAGPIVPRVLSHATSGAQASKRPASLAIGSTTRQAAMSPG